MVRSNLVLTINVARKLQLDLHHTEIWILLYSTDCDIISPLKADNIQKKYNDFNNNLLKFHLRLNTLISGAWSLTQLDVGICMSALLLYTSQRSSTYISVSW